MSTVDLLIGLKFKTEIAEFKAEILLDESHEYSTTSTDYPVESGVSVSDHVIKNPQKVTLNFLVSDTPLTILGARNVANSLLGVTETQKAYDYFSTLWKDGEVFRLITKYEVFFDMIVESFTPSRNNRLGQALNFSVILKKFKTVQSQVSEVSAEKATPPQRPRQQGAADKGKQTTTPPSAGTATKTSILKGGLG